MATDTPQTGGAPAPETPQIEIMQPGETRVSGDAFAPEPEADPNAAVAAAEPEIEAPEGENDAGEVEPKAKKPKQTASERIKELNARLRESERALETEKTQNYQSRLENIEKLLKSPENGNTVEATQGAPDSSDLRKYPLGSLDDRYIEDTINYRAEKAAERLIGSVQQRQLESEARVQAEQVAEEILGKISALSDKGTPLFDDFYETVVEPGMRQEYKLTQETFEAICEVEHGAEVLRGLALNKAEAARVASLSPYQQIKYVTDKSTEIATKKAPRRIPGAGTPPNSAPRGSNGKFTGNVDVTNYSDVRKAMFGK